jgi:DNA polymerase-4
VLRAQADELARDLQARALRGATIGIKAKRADFTVIGRQTQVAVATSDADVIFAAAVHCWRRSGLDGRPIRLLGTRIASLTEEVPRELSLFS